MQESPQPLPGYFLDAENVAEMARLTKQAQFISAITGLFPSEIDLSRVESILDIGSGPGTWVLAVARDCPMKQILGIDISQLMTSYASYLATEQSLPRVAFRIMDVRQPLDPSIGRFDLIHLRFISFPTKERWPVLLRECYQLLTPGGVLISTEGENLGICTSPALTRYNTLLVEAARRLGQCWTSEGSNLGITAVQRHLLTQAGFINIREIAHVQNASSGMPMHGVFYENWVSLLKLLQPLLTGLGLASQEELDLLYTRALDEMRAPNFCHAGLFQTVWGEKPAGGE